jgi:hypothetical protein
MPWSVAVDGKTAPGDDAALEGEGAGEPTDGASAVADGACADGRDDPFDAGD